MSFDLGQLVITFLVLLFSLTVHESAHAWTAARLGDPTARRLGRITLNPAAHIDPFGDFVAAVTGVYDWGAVIGWAKPVPVIPANLTRPRRDFLCVAAAGPASNMVLAVIAAGAMRALPVSPLTVGAGLELPLWEITAILFKLNLLLAIFNMVPVPSLDGGNVLAGLLPAGIASGYDRLIRPWGFLSLYALLLTGALSALIMPPYLFLSWLLTK